ncbi:MAG: DUF4038 domain-containing protein [Opitutaceae bacterium]|nr:DUF4038 domain-containing protein [Opitutaceae bacterium]
MRSRAFMPLVCLFLLAGAGLWAAYPLSISSDGHGFIDKAGNRFLLLGDTGWLIQRQPLDQVEWYFEQRRNQGFNTVMVDLVPLYYEVGTGKLDVSRGPREDANGNKPLGGDRWREANEAYFNYTLQICQAAEARGMLLILQVPVVNLVQSIMQYPTSEQEAAARRLGSIVGARFAAVQNLLWSPSHGDQDLAGNKALVRAFVIGLRSSGANQLVTSQGMWRESSREQLQGEDWLDVNGVYTYFPGDRFKAPQVYAAMTRAVAAKPAMPAFLLESQYEHGPFPLLYPRRQAWWAILSGAAGMNYGSEKIYFFEKDSWRDSVWSPGAEQMMVIHKFLADNDNQRWLPDLAGELLAEGEGMRYLGTLVEDGGSDFATAARREDGRAWAVYFPTTRNVIELRTATVAGHSRAWWMDPTTGVKSECQLRLPSLDRRLHVTPPAESNGGGGGDWVLVLVKE